MTLTLAVDKLSELPSGVGLAVNLSPETAATSALGDALADISGERVTIEITEHAKVDVDGNLHATLAQTRQGGSQPFVVATTTKPRSAKSAATAPFSPRSSSLSRARWGGAR